jgi:GcrA cell cycle regulator
MGVHDNIGAKAPRVEWTDERVEALASMWREGLSASAIAKSLGGVTRSAVIGKAFREALPRRREDVKKLLVKEGLRRANGGPGKGWRATKPTRLPKQRDRVKLVGGTVFMQGPGHEPRAMALDDAFNALPGSVAVPFLERARGGCRWPIDNEAGEPMCCNRPIDPKHPSYCWDHRKLSGVRSMTASDALKRDERRAAKKLLEAA